MKKRTKRRIFWYFRSKFVRKHVSRKTDCKGCYGHSSNSALRNNQDQGIICAAYGSKNNNFLFKVHPLTNIEISKYYSNNSRLNCVFFRR